jgi:protoporphyrinogen oxidase
MKLLILGGGVAGSVAARCASKYPVFDHICLLEKETHLGGLHQDVILDGIHYDIGAFFFSTHHELVNIFPELKDILVKVDEYKTLSLTNNNTLDIYPPTASRYIKDYGIVRSALDLLGLVGNRIKFSLKGKKLESVDDSACYLMGPFYERMGLKNYITRLYGIDPSEVSLEFSTKRLQYLHERLTLNGLLSSLKKYLKLDLVNQNPDKFDRVAHEIYVRPKEGFSAMYGQIHQLLQSCNIDVRMGSQIQKISLKDKEIMMSDGTQHNYDRVISSIPLGLLCRLCDIPLSMKLTFKPLYSLMYEADKEPIPNCYVLFNFSNRGQWKRITSLSSYYGQESGKHYFVVESMPYDSQLNDPSVVEILNKDFKSVFENTPWAENINNSRLVGHHLTPNAYPIYGKEFSSQVIDELQKVLNENGIYLAGRQGTFDYLTSSDAALSAVKTVKCIVEDSESIDIKFSTVGV